MIITELYEVREDGVRLMRTYSNKNMKIMQDGTSALYEEAVDPEFTGRTYTETDIPLEEEEGTAEELLNIILGEGEA